MKFSIKYQLSPRTEGDRLTENVPIRLRVSFAGIRVDLRSGYVIDAEKWDNNNACVKIGANRVKTSSTIDERFVRARFKIGRAHV